MSREIPGCDTPRTLAKCTVSERIIPADCRPFTSHTAIGSIRLPIPLRYFEISDGDTQINERTMFIESRESIGATGLTQLSQYKAGDDAIVVTENTSTDYEHPVAGTMRAGPIPGNKASVFNDGEYRLIFDNWYHSDEHPITHTPGAYTIASSQLKHIKYVGYAYPFRTYKNSCCGPLITHVDPAPNCDNSACAAGAWDLCCCEFDLYNGILVAGSPNHGVVLCGSCSTVENCGGEIIGTATFPPCPPLGEETYNVNTFFYSCAEYDFDDTYIGCLGAGVAIGANSVALALPLHIGYTHVLPAMWEACRCNSTDIEYINVSSADDYTYNIQIIGTFGVTIILEGHLPEITNDTFLAAEGHAYIIGGGSGLTWSGWVRGWSNYVGSGNLALDSNIGTVLLTKDGFTFKKIFPYINRDQRSLHNTCQNTPPLPRFEEGFDPFGENVEVTLITIFVY